MGVEEEFTCKQWDMTFWYKNELNDHLKSKHGIADPIKHEREEKQKRLAELQKKKQQQQAALSQVKRPILQNGMRPPPPKPSMHTRSLASSILQNRGNDMLRRFADRSGTLKNINGIRSSMIPGRIPPRVGGGKLRTKGTAGFQFRDGVFICVNCGKEFTDGQQMVKHSYCKLDKSKVKKNEKKREAERRRKEKKERKKDKKSKRRRSRRGGSVSSLESDSEEEIIAATEDENDTETSDKEIIVAESDKKDKKKGYWTPYLLWSKRKRKEINKEEPDLSFAEVSKAISIGWKEVTAEETRQLKEEADELNANNVKKLPDNKAGSDESENSEEEDPSFDETKLKKVVTEEIEVKEPVRRSRRNMKNPNFAKNIAAKEEKFDELLDYNEEKQIKESIDAEGNPKKKIKKEVKGKMMMGLVHRHQLVVNI